ncbi:MAG: right-handed parallel beta-helix repeat-containing protein [Planctomycetota bacterium]|jgi:hypothetical protein
MAKKNITTIACFIVVLTVNSALGAIRYVPQDYDNIQDAIDACQDLDTVVIATGRYTGSGNRNINFRGKAITVRSTDPNNSQIISETVIDCEGQGRGFAFYMGEKADSTLSGLTITNGYGILGGAIYCYNNSSPSINNCVIKTNSAVFGGGLACTGSNTKPKITNCIITANTVIVGGGGFYINVSSPIIRNCIISGNVAPDGGAFFSYNVGNPIITNCTISQNTASRSTGVIIFCYESSNMALTNSIFWDNITTNASQIKVGNSGAATSIRISYCNIQGGKDNIISDENCTVEWGQGNIDADPNFVSSGSLTGSESLTAGDYHLLDGSPCIDAGDPEFITEPNETDIDGNPRIAGTKIDMGADEFVPPLAVVVTITPKTLNLRSSGGWIFCTIQFPNEHSISDVDTDSILLNKEIKPVSYTTDEKANKVVAKYDRKVAQEFSNLTKDLEGSVHLTITGKLIDGTKFKGSDAIKILNTTKILKKDK